MSNIAGYVSIKEAAQLLGLSSKRVYEYVDEGRLTSLWAADVIMIPLDEVSAFKRQSSGRPRKSVPSWRISTGDNAQFMTTITVQIRNYTVLLLRLERIRRHTFPGTVARYITESGQQITISLVWKRAIMPNETMREQALEALKQELADILDWSTAQYAHSKILMHA
jgi:excisionase family DNA binding protein